MDALVISYSSNLTLVDKVLHCHRNVKENTDSTLGARHFPHTKACLFLGSLPLGAVGIGRCHQSYAMAQLYVVVLNGTCIRRVWFTDGLYTGLL